MAKEIIVIIQNIIVTVFGNKGIYAASNIQSNKKCHDKYQMQTKDPLEFYFRNDNVDIGET